MSPGRQAPRRAPDRGRRHRRGRRRAGRVARPGRRARRGSPAPGRRRPRLPPAAAPDPAGQPGGAAVEQLPRSRVALFARRGTARHQRWPGLGFRRHAAWRPARRAEHRGPRQRAMGARNLRPHHPRPGDRTRRRRLAGELPGGLRPGQPGRAHHRWRAARQRVRVRGGVPLGRLPPGTRRSTGTSSAPGRPARASRSGRPPASRSSGTAATGGWSPRPAATGETPPPGCPRRPATPSFPVRGEH